MTKGEVKEENTKVDGHDKDIIYDNSDINKDQTVGQE